MMWIVQQQARSQCICEHFTAATMNSRNPVHLRHGPVDLGEMLPQSALNQCTWKEYCRKHRGRSSFGTDFPQQERIFCIHSGPGWDLTTTIADSVHLVWIFVYNGFSVFGMVCFRKVVCGRLYALCVACWEAIWRLSVRGHLTSERGGPFDV